MIEKEVIAHIKSTVDLLAFVRSKGIEMKKRGQSCLGLCPFHDDKKPSFSITPAKNEWHCFGCGKGGDVIRFVELFDGVDFVTAVEQLSGKQDIPTRASIDEKQSSETQSSYQQYLDRVIAIYENNFAKNDAAKKYLNERGITDAGLFNQYAVGYCDGTLKEILPKNGGIHEVLKELGILLDDGSERFLNCVVFPVYDLDGHVVTLYGRRIGADKRHLYLPRRPTGLWNGQVIKNCLEIIVTESVIDALSVQMAGFKNVVSIQSTNGLSDREIMDLKIYRITEITLLMDGDDAGKKAVLRLKEKLAGFTVRTVTLPDGHDPNSYLQAEGPEKLAALIQSANREPAADDPEQPLAAAAVPFSQSVAIPCGIRNYQVMSLDKGPHKLKVTLRLEHAGKLHVDTLDLYTARARKNLAADICRIFEESPDIIDTDITRIIRECERMTDETATTEKQTTSAPTLTEKEKSDALAFGKSTNLIDIILKDFQTCGLIGEEANKLLGYIAMTSRKRREPISIQILSSSGAGKTALQDAIVDFCPPEDLVKLTSLSGKALFYKDRLSLKHKVLALEEGDGAEEASYAIRSLISAGVLINETTIKDLSTGRLTTMENRVEGPTAVFYTTTNPDVDPETKSRFFVTGIDESREQTRKILAFQRTKHSRDDMTESVKTDAVIAKHHNFQRLLKPLGVKNPYGSQLTYGDDRLQGRRDQPKYLNLIKSVAFLRQMQKQTRFSRKDVPAIAYIEADLKDIRIANKLAREILGRSLDELSRPGRDLLMLLDEMIEKQWHKVVKKETDTIQKRTQIAFTRRTIREYTGWSNTRVHRYLKELVDLEYVLIDTGRNGSRYRYRLAYEGQGKDGSKFILGLTSVNDLTKAVK